MPQSAQAANPLVNLVPLILIFVIFYFMLIRPQKKREAEHKKLLNNLNKNDEAVTTGGIHGTIVSVKERTVLLRVDENVKIEVEKSSIGYVKKQQGAAS